jgi:hypothetical protein
MCCAVLYRAVLCCAVLWLVDSAVTSFGARRTVGCMYIGYCMAGIVKDEKMYFFFLLSSARAGSLRLIMEVGGDRRCVVSQVRCRHARIALMQAGLLFRTYSIAPFVRSVGWR